MNFNPLVTAWFDIQEPETAAPADGLNTLRMALVAMEGGMPLDAATAAHLTAAFRSYLDEGKTDLSANLGLKGRRGRSCESPLRREKLEKRDELLMQALNGLGGNTPANRLLLSSLLAADDLSLPDCFCYTKPVMRVRQESGGRLEISDRQLARIAADEPAYRKKLRT